MKLVGSLALALSRKKKSIKKYASSLYLQDKYDEGSVVVEGFLCYKQVTIALRRLGILSCFS